jgi:bifunctional DNase/RNase
MNKIELEISDITPSGSTSGAYALVLAEVGGTRRLPIVIGGNEAQAIAIEMEKMTPSRPLTHDLFKSFSKSFSIDIEEIIIYNLVEGVFFARIVAIQDGRKAEIDSRTSDAVAIAVRFDCPIYCYDFILERAGVETDGLEDEEESVDMDLEKEAALTEKHEDLSLEDLQRMLEAAVEREEFEKAGKIRDEINRRRSGS